jgi:hypothetical protein
MSELLLARRAANNRSTSMCIYCVPGSRCIYSLFANIPPYSDLCYLVTSLT